MAFQIHFKMQINTSSKLHTHAFSFTEREKADEAYLNAEPVSVSHPFIIKSFNIGCVHLVLMSLILLGVRTNV